MTHLAEEVEVATRGRGYLATLARRHVTVVGLAKSGIAAARLLAAAGADVCGTDAKPVASLGPEVAALATAGVRLIDGPAAFDGVELVVVSPGVPLDGAQLVPARTRRVPVIGELELAWRAMEAETIAITGTNGKTTTTALTGALLAEQPRPVFVGGNIGTPLAARALDFPADGLVVAEVSSFQLETIEALQPPGGLARPAVPRVARRWPRGRRPLVAPARDHRRPPAPRAGRSQPHTRSTRSAPHDRPIPRRQGAHLHEPDRAGLRGAQRRRRGRPRPCGAHARARAVVQPPARPRARRVRAGRLAGGAAQRSRRPHLPTRGDPAARRAQRRKRAGRDGVCAVDG